MQIRDYNTRKHNSNFTLSILRNEIVHNLNFLFTKENGSGKETDRGIEWYERSEKGIYKDITLINENVPYEMKVQK